MATTKKDNINYAKGERFVNFSKGTMRQIFFGMAPLGTYKLALNMDSDVEVGSLVSRLGTAIVGVQRQAGASCLGIGNYNRTQSAGSKLFAVFSDGTNNIVKDMIDNTKNLTGDTKNLKTRFCSYLDEIVRVNGTDAAKAYNNTAWITTGGAFDLANMPLFDKVIEWKDRIYGALPNSDKVTFSSIANPSTRTISWTDITPTTGTGYIMMAQEDGGGGITAFEKVPGYLLVFKQRTMKRWDGSTTFPEDLVNQGVPSQECVTRSKEIVYFINQKGIWVTNGGYPVRISRPIQDFVDNIADFTKVSSWGDDEHVYFSLGNVSIGLDTYSNVVLKYNIEDVTWDVRSYYNSIQAMSQYVDSAGKRWVVIGDNDGQTLVLNSGTTDYASAVKTIPWTVEPNYIDWGMLGNIKEVSRMITYTENVSTGKVLWRNTKQGADYKDFGRMTEDVTELNSPNNAVKGNYIGFKFVGTTNSERIKFIGFEFPQQSVLISMNTKE
ncbi:MAG: hypothetical protein NTW30_06100 [Candidatus Aenigmarchaeota archaeon]|nr:hypothetical protein [Candidatus Aenigmarchaeota archaeon]